MTKRNRHIRLAAIIYIMVAASLVNASPAGQTPTSGPTGRTWLFLEPEAISPPELSRRLEEFASRMPERALKRRIKSLGWPGVRPCDLPPSPERIQAIEETGCRVVRVLHYLGAIVVEGSANQTDGAARLSFVKSTAPVEAIASSIDIANLPEDVPSRLSPKLNFDDYEEYGTSLSQSLVINIPAAHAEGYHGEGVLIGVQDTGFDFQRHRAFANIDVIATHDFLNGDDNVGDEGDRGSSTHGTRVLSVIAGLDSGNYIGVAPKAQFVLTKTENSESETPIEEDIWVEGLWFHDSLGVDVMSSSLSYRDWHDYPDYDGMTAVTSRAADSAAAAGLVIVNSMGNTGLNAYPRNKLGAPADSRGVISIGGVNRDSSRWQSASQGPTYDGRIKPDVVAVSSLVYTVNTVDNSSYAGRSGTSFSTPTVAGVAALVMQANPELTPAEVKFILHRTASQSNSPDTLTGYGIVNALTAVNLAKEMSVANESAPVTHQLFGLYPNPTNGRAIVIRYGMTDQYYELRDISGRLIQDGMTGNSIDLENYPAGSYWVGSKEIGWRKLVLLK